MTNGRGQRRRQAGARQARTRLARRRPGPGRVRVRRPPRTRGWWRRVDWAGASTVTAVVAGLAGILLTAVSTLFGVLVSEGELEQSREDAAREVRAQAVRVSYWTEYRTDVDGRLHVMNRSPDPVTDVNLLLEHTPAGGLHVLRIPALAPCTEVITKLGEGDLLAPGGQPADALRWMAFRDRDGAHWQRDGSGLSRLPDDWDVHTIGSTEFLEITGIIPAMDDVSERKAPACRDDA